MYYKDIYDLSEQMQQEVIHELYQNAQNLEIFFQSIVQFNEELARYREEKGLDKKIAILFSGRQEFLLKLCTKELKARLVQSIPEAAEDLQFDILVTYVVYGSCAHMVPLREKDSGEQRAIINDMTQTLIQKYRPKCLT